MKYLLLLICSTSLGIIDAMGFQKATGFQDDPDSCYEIFLECADFRPGQSGKLVMSGNKHGECGQLFTTCVDLINNPDLFGPGYAFWYQNPIIGPNHNLEYNYDYDFYSGTDLPDFIFERNLGEDQNGPTGPCSKWGGDWNCCASEGPGNGECGALEGDCNYDWECGKGLMCGSNNCGRGFPAFADCCIPQPADDKKENQKQEKRKNNRKTFLKFHKIDSDGSNYLDFEEITRHLNLDEVSVKKVLEVYDQDGDGFIQPWEFDQDLDSSSNKKSKLPNKESDNLNTFLAFHKIDTDGSNYLDGKEIARYLKLDKEAVQKVLEEYDQNGDGIIQPKEFDQDLDK